MPFCVEYNILFWNYYIISIQIIIKIVSYIIIKMIAKLIINIIIIMLSMFFTKCQNLLRSRVYLFRI